MCLVVPGSKPTCALLWRLKPAFVPALLSHNVLLRLHGQALWQLAALGATLAVALVGGTVAGVIVAKINPAGHSLGEDGLFEDAVFWCAALRRPARHCINNALGWVNGFVSLPMHEL